MKHVVTQLMIVCVLGVLAGAAAAKTTVVSISMNSIRTHTGERGTFYVLDLSIPNGVEASGLDRVVLEFALDASAATHDDSLATPVVGVYPITRAFAANRGDGPVGTVEAPEIGAITPSSRPVAIGEHRVLRMDITDIVKGWMRDPSSNHGLVIGTLTGPRVGTVTLNRSLPGGGTPVRATFFCRDGAVPTRQSGS